MRIRVENVSKKFGRVWALEEITLELEPGQIVLVPLVILVVPGMVILWATILIVDRPEVLVGAMAAVAASVGVCAAYGWWYNRKVDLLRDRQ